MELHCWNEVALEQLLEVVLPEGVVVINCWILLRLLVS